MTKKKTQLVALVLAISFFLPGMSMAKNKKLDDDNGNAAFAITGVSPSEFNPEAVTAVTITGTGFSDGLKAGIIKGGNIISSATGLTDISAVFGCAVQMTATVPAGLTAGEYDLYVYDPNQATFTYAKKEEALELEMEAEGDNPAYQHSSSNAARRKVDVTFNGISRDVKKKWMKVRINGKNVPITKVRKNDTNSLVLTLNVKYKGLAPGSYDLVLTYKNRLRLQNGTKKNGRIKYSNSWERKTETLFNWLTITP